MHREPPLDNRVPQCTLPAATPPPAVAHCYRGGRKPSPCQILTSRESRAEDNGDSCQVEGGWEHWQATCAPHFARAIYLLHLLPPLFVRTWRQKACTLAALATLCSGKVGRERGQQQEEKRHIERETKSSSPL